MFMRRDDRPGQLPDSHYERLANGFGVAVDDLKVFSQLLKWDDAWLFRLRGLTEGSGEHNKYHLATEYQSSWSFRQHFPFIVELLLRAILSACFKPPLTGRLLNLSSR